MATDGFYSGRRKFSFCDRSLNQQGARETQKCVCDGPAIDRRPAMASRNKPLVAVWHEITTRPEKKRNDMGPVSRKPRRFSFLRWLSDRSLTNIAIVSRRHRWLIAEKSQTLKNLLWVTWQPGLAGCDYVCLCVYVCLFLYVNNTNDA